MFHTRSTISKMRCGSTGKKYEQRRTYPILTDVGKNALLLERGEYGRRRWEHGPTVLLCVVEVINVSFPFETFSR
jgi:hypothetical protein